MGAGESRVGCGESACPPGSNVVKDKPLCANGPGECARHSGSGVAPRECLFVDDLGGAPGMWIDGGGDVGVGGFMDEERW